MKNVLITGANSYIGVSFEKWARKYYGSALSIDTVDMIDGSWREKDFSSFDVVFHVAGIAHADVGNVSEEVKAKYYAVNTDLAIETAKKAKNDGVKQFVFMSSMIVYGKQTHISSSTKPRPANFYGDSKWKADKGVRELQDESFTVTVLRPPMIYGKGSKGNYPTLSKLARKVPVFPDYQNKRSMLFIENLCEFLCLVMTKGLGGVYWPQNGEYSSTSDIVREISNVVGKHTIVTKILNPAVLIAKRFPVKKIRNLAVKAFGDSWYEMDMSTYGFNYQIVDFKESIKRTEMEKGNNSVKSPDLESNSKRRTIWIIDHYSSEPKYGGISRQYDFAKELDKRGYVVVIFSSGFSHYTHTYISEKEMYITKPFKHVRYVYVKTHSYGENNGKDRALNMFSFMTQVLKYAPKAAKQYGKPDVIEGVSVHPLAWIAAYKLSKKYKVRFVAEVRDFWPQVWIDSGEKKATSPMCVFFRMIEKFTYKHADHIIYSQYHGDRYLCDEMHVPKNKVMLIGQVMDCERYDRNKERLELLPKEIKEFISSGFVCCFTGYYMKYNGVYEILEALKILQNKGLPIKMVFVGNGEEKEGMKRYVNENHLKDVYIGDRVDREAVPVLASHSDICIAQAEQRGKPNVYRYGVSLLKLNEYLYSGTTILFGFRFEDNEVVESHAGLQYVPYDSNDLAEKIELVYRMNPEERELFGQNGRQQSVKFHSVTNLTNELLNIFFLDS